MFVSIRSPLCRRTVGFLTIFAIVVVPALFPCSGTAQDGVPFQSAGLPLKSADPSNAFLASPAIERRVDNLLKQMTLEEKIGQLVQYGGDGSEGVDEAAARALWRSPGKNPTPPAPVGAMQLAAAGRLGSMLNVVGAERTNAFQHAAVEKGRLHIPLLFERTLSTVTALFIPSPWDLPQPSILPWSLRSLTFRPKRLAQQASNGSILRWWISRAIHGGGEQRRARRGSISRRRDGKRLRSRVSEGENDPRRIEPLDACCASLFGRNVSERSDQGRIRRLRRVRRGWDK